ncbi:hypothetical protein V1506DRAFT_507593 [Lipomyces tetrasporus]
MPAPRRPFRTVQGVKFFGNLRDATANCLNARERVWAQDTRRTNGNIEYVGKTFLVATCKGMFDYLRSQPDLPSVYEVIATKEPCRLYLDMEMLPAEYDNFTETEQFVTPDAFDASSTTTTTTNTDTTTARGRSGCSGALGRVRTPSTSQGVSWSSGASGKDWKTRRDGTPADRAEYMRRKYLEKKALKAAARGAAGSTTAARLVDAARQISESAIFADQYKLDVLQMGILTLRDLAEFPRSCGSLRGSRRSAVDEVASVARFFNGSREYRKIKLDQAKNQPWLPLRIDAADLVPAWSNRAEWVEEVRAGMEDFTGSNLLERVDVRRSVPRNVLLAFEPFVVLDRVWARETWGLVKIEFRDYVRELFPAATRTQVEYLRLWLLVPWVLTSHRHIGRAT